GYSKTGEIPSCRTDRGALRRPTAGEKAATGDGTGAPETGQSRVRDRQPEHSQSAQQCGALSAVAACRG
ncbi:hypothetical protein ABTN61_20060, partial [Acinetobacter baumannii]